MLVIGKTIGGGIPVGRLRDVTHEVGDRIRASLEVVDSDVGGIGGTLAGYALSLAATRATLGEVLTEAAFERMIPLAERWESGVNDVPGAVRRPVARHPVGARAEYHFMAEPPRTAPSRRPTRIRTSSGTSISRR